MKPAFLLALDEGRWMIGRCHGSQVEQRFVAFDKDKGPASVIQGLQVPLRELGYDGQGVCLGLPSSMLFWAQIDCQKQPRKDRREAMGYRLEEHLPIEAERLTSDFLTLPGGRALAVAVQTEPVRLFLDPLAAADIAVHSICPTALLCLSTEIAGRPAADFAVLAWPGHLDIFRLSGQVPSGWYRTSRDPTEALRFIQADLLIQPVGGPQVQVILLGEYDEALRSALADKLPATFASDQLQDPFILATTAAEELAAGKQAGWIDLRREGLAQANPWGQFARLVRAAIVLALVFLAVTAAGLTWRGWRYDNMARQYETDHVAEFQRALPNSPVPGNIPSRMHSELTRMAGLSGSGQQVPDQPSALDALRAVVGALPRDVKLRVNELRISPAGILMEGQALGHSDAAAISGALGQAGLAADPPRTEQSSKGDVSFTIAARMGATTRPTTTVASGAKP